MKSCDHAHQSYAECVELYTAARQVLNSVSFGGSKFKAQLRDYTEEQLLMTELLLWNKRGGALDTPEYSTLVSKAKSYYTNRHHCEHARLYDVMLPWLRYRHGYAIPL